MNKIIIKVPKEIRFLSQWNEFKLPDHHVIINKQITGCGFTEWAIRNNLPIVLCSPRKLLLENKSAQHSEEVFYVENKIEKSLSIDEDLSSKNNKSTKKEEDIIDPKIILESVNNLKSKIKRSFIDFKFYNKTPKFLVTYDSLRYVIESLRELGVLNEFYFIVDEFQSIFSDSRFKADTELEFVNNLQGINKVSYVSATPMLDRYLELMDEFKNLDYYELDWRSENPSRIITPNLKTIPYSTSINTIVKSIIEDFFNENYEIDIKAEGDKIIETEAKELVFYVNSVKNICDIVKKCNLTLDQVNIICADTSENREKIRKIFGLKKREKEREGIGSIPLKDEKNKPITFCTKTAYLGADFYSKCARSIIISDSSIECLAVDIIIDLPQILGRQRDEENPWKNCAEIYFKAGTGIKDISKEEFDKIIQEKIKETEALLRSYNDVKLPSDRHTLAKKYLRDASISRYKYDYISVNKHAGSDLIPQMNKLVLISEQRAFDIQQVDYKDRFSVISTINNSIGGINEDEYNLIDGFIHDLKFQTQFRDKMKYICEFIFNNPEIKSIVLNIIPKMFKNYIIAFGPDGCKSLSYQKSKLEFEYKNMKNRNNNDNNIFELMDKVFIVGKRYTNTYIKSELTKLYKKLDISDKAKANDIEEWYEVKVVKITNPETKKRDFGFELISRRSL